MSVSVPIPSRGRQQIQQTDVSGVLPVEIALLPVRCWSCGKVIVQDPIEDSINSGKTLRDTMDQLGYNRICCRRTIQTSPRIVYLINQQEASNKVVNYLNGLPVEITGVSTAPIDLGGNIRILENASVPSMYRGSFLPPAAEVETQPSVGAFEHFMGQIAHDEDED